MLTDLNAPACRDANPETFFPIGDVWNLDVAENATRYAAAKRICGGCPALEACRGRELTAADPIAILGGLTPDERKAARRRQAAPVATGVSA